MASVQHQTLIAGLKEFQISVWYPVGMGFQGCRKRKSRFPSLFQSVGCTGGEMGVVTKLNQCLNSSRSSPDHLMSRKQARPLLYSMVNRMYTQPEQVLGSSRQFNKRADISWLLKERKR
jgi:hypothetical protein